MDLRLADHRKTVVGAAPGSWAKKAACSGQRHLERFFFPERGESTAPAKAMCAQCPVRFECLEFALSTHQQFGIWGGLSVRERRRIVRDRRRVAS